MISAPMLTCEQCTSSSLLASLMSSLDNRGRFGGSFRTRSGAYRTVSNSARPATSTEIYMDQVLAHSEQKLTTLCKLQTHLRTRCLAKEARLARRAEGQSACLRQ